MTVAPWRLTLAAVLTVALALAVVSWVVAGGGGADARPTTPAQAAAAAASRSSAAAVAAASAADRARQADIATLPDVFDGVFGGGGDTWSVSVRAVASGATSSLGATSGMVTGSTIKLLLLENLLRTSGGVDDLTSADRAAAGAMITESSNDAATQVWDAGGGDDALQTTVDLLGLTHTDIAEDGYFGVSTTSSSDQLTVLAQLLAPTFLSSTDVAYANGLLADVESDQRWGVPTMTDPGTSTENKNGWLDVDTDDGLWLVDSVGIVTIGGVRYLVAAFSQHQPDFDTGVDRLDTALAALAAALRS